MGLFVEVVCDRRTVGYDASRGEYLCESNSNNNPSGPNVKAAKDEARRLGWRLGTGRKAVCPNCKDITPAGQSALETK